jgi:CBS domain-containing protein
MREEVGEENIFYADAFVFRSTQLAFARARALVEARDGAGAPGGPPPGGALAASAVSEPTARDLMRPDVIRFGVSHRLREAVWLLSEARKRKRELKRLFLQGDDARLAGAVGLHLILRQFQTAMKEIAESRPGTGETTLIHQAWDRIHRRRLRAITQWGHESLLPTATLSEVADAMLKHGLDIIPITLDGRVIGQVFAQDVAKALQRRMAP